MAVLNVSKPITEQVFQRMELGKSYSITARKIDSAKEEYQITSGESLIFIDNIDCVVKYNEMTTNTFYKKLFEMIKNTKSPIIVSCENKIPFALQKKSSLFEFIHLKRSLSEEEVLMLHGNLIYFLERTQCIPELIKKVDVDLKEIADTLKDLPCPDNLLNPQIKDIVKRSEGNVTLFLSMLYELLQMNTYDMYHDDSVVTPELLDYRSLLDSFEQKQSNKVQELTSNFLSSMSIYQLPSYEYPMTIEYLGVRIKT
jgi:hypothetical protein